jgi:predicted hotdog family 3-hydroxylacyl-ACP dehydratase
LICKEELQTLIPHRGKMLLLDRIIEYDIEGSMRAEYDITKDCLFYDSTAGGVPAWAGFELMAQTISALAGIRSRERGETPKFGFIISIPFMQIEIPVFRLGSRVDIRVKEFDRTDLVYTFEGEIFLEDKKVMEGRIMVMEVSNEQTQALKEGYNGTR